MDDQLRTQKNTASPQASKWIAVIVLVVIVGAGGFVGGMQYQKGHSSSTTSASATNRFGGQNGMGGFRQNGGFGTVTAASATSLSIQERRTGSTKTYSITSSTKITNNGASATYNDLAVGTSVIVRTSNSTSTTATEIMVNPSMGGGMQGQAGGTQGAGANDPSASGTSST